MKHVSHRPTRKIVLTYLVHICLSTKIRLTTTTWIMYKVLAAFIYCGWACGCIIIPLLPHFSAHIYNVGKIPWSLVVFKLYSYNVIEAQAPPRLVSTPTLIMCKVFDNHHILWIDKWVHYNPNRPHLSPQTILKVSRKYLVTGGVQKIPLRCVWGSSPTQIGSHIHLNLNHVQGVWQPADAVDGHMDASSSYYHHTWYRWFGMWAEIAGHWRYMKNIIMLWLRLKPHPYWFTSFLIMHSKASTTIIICGVAHGSIITPLPPHLLFHICNTSFYSWSLLGNKWYHFALVEAQVPPRMITIFIFLICKVFGIVHICCGWAYGCIITHYRHSCSIQFWKWAYILCGL